MAAYVLSDIAVFDPDAYEDYRRRVSAVIEKYGGRYLVRGGASELLEGDRQPNRLIVIEFPDMDALRRWYRSDEYQALLRIRQSAARSTIVAVREFDPVRRRRRRAAHRVPRQPCRSGVYAGMAVGTGAPQAGDAETQSPTEEGEVDVCSCGCR